MKLTDNQKVTLIAASLNGFCANPHYYTCAPSELTPLVLAMVDSIIIELERKDEDEREQCADSL